MTYEDQFCDWLFEQGVDAALIAEIAFMEIAYEEHVAEYDVQFLKEMGIAA